MLSTRPNLPHNRPSILQFAMLPAMMSDAHENHRNSARAGRPQRLAATCARGRNHVAAHISRAMAIAGSFSCGDPFLLATSVCGLGPL